MKKEIYKIFRRTRRNIARFIVGYDRCPASYRKKYGQLATVTAKNILFVIGAVGFFLALILFFS